MSANQSSPSIQAGSIPSGPSREVVDPRGPRFGASITSVVLAATLVLGPRWGVVPLAVQTVAFAAGSLLGLKYQPYGWIFRKAVRPRLAPPTEFEDAAPPRFAQGVGLAFAVIGLVGVVLHASVVFYIAIAFALVAALLNAFFNFCLGCEIYLLGHRLFNRATPADGAAR